jgi:hypothetical protein
MYWRTKPAPKNESARSARCSMWMARSPSLRSHHHTANTGNWPRYTSVRASVASFTSAITTEMGALVRMFAEGTLSVEHSRRKRRFSWASPEYTTAVESHAPEATTLPPCSTSSR